MSPSTRLSSRRKGAAASQAVPSKKRRAFKDVSNNAKRKDGTGGNRSKRHRSGAAVEKRSTRGSHNNNTSSHQQQHNPPPDHQFSMGVAAPVPPDVALDRRATSRRRSTRLRRDQSKSAAASDFASSFVVVKKEKEPVPTPDNRLIGNEYQYRGTVDLMDERDKDDPSCACPYVNDMYETFREKEVTTTPHLYLSNQPQISEGMRSILVDWLVEVHLKFRLVPETLYLTVNIADRYLSRKAVSKKNLQLVGVTSLMIAAKYEEIYPMGLEDLVYICDSAYTRSDLLEMEYEILRALNYAITIPTAHSFLVRFLKAAHADKRLVQISCMVLDSTLLRYKLLEYLPSQLAAAAIAIARHSIGRNIWSPTLLRYAYYSQEEIIPVARAVYEENLLIDETDLKSVHKKYSSTRYGAVADTMLISLDD